MFGGRRKRREQELAALDRWRLARRLMDEDVTVLGEQVAELHVDTLADDLDPAARDHYRRALEHYDQAKHLLAASRTLDDVVAIEQVTADARYHRAAVIAVRDGDPLPERREPCFFDPRHGPSMQEVEWTPPGGTARTIGVCAADARRLSVGDRATRAAGPDRGPLGPLAPGRRHRGGHRRGRPSGAVSRATVCTASRTWRRSTSTRPSAEPTGPAASEAADRRTGELLHDGAQVTEVTSIVGVLASP